MCFCAICFVLVCFDVDLVFNLLVGLLCVISVFQIEGCISTSQQFLLATQEPHHFLE